MFKCSVMISIYLQCNRSCNYYDHKFITKDFNIFLSRILFTLLLNITHIFLEEDGLVCYPLGILGCSLIESDLRESSAPDKLMLPNDRVLCPNLASLITSS